jgi:transglutaminase-like putative cysteine protease
MAKCGWRFLAVGCLLSAVCCLRAAEIDDLIRSAPGADKYPEAGALVLLDRTSVTIDASNNAVTERYLVVKILADRGKEDYGDIHQRYNKDAQRCDVLVARTHRPDGSIVEPEKKAIADVSAPEVWSAPAYTNAMHKVISFPALEPNAVIELRLRVSPTKSGKDEALSGTALFGTYDPVLKREFILTLPAKTPLHYGWTGAGPEPVCETVGPNVGLTWSMDNLPQVFREPGRAPLERLVPRLWYSSYRDWNQVGKYLWQPFAKGLVSTPELVAKAQELAKDKPKPDALRDIYLYVTRKFQNVYLDYGQVGYEPHKAADVVEQKYGDCRDKTCLLITLLRAAGIKAAPVVLGTDWVQSAPSVPSPDAYDWMVCRANDGARDVFLDPFGEYLPYGSLAPSEQPAEAMVLDSTGFAQVSIPAGLPENNRAEVTATYRLDTLGNLTGTAEASCIGYYDYVLRRDWRDATPVERKQAFDELAGSIKTGATADSFWTSDLSDLTRGAEIGFRFTAERYASRQADRLYFRVPAPELVFEPVMGQTQARQRHTLLMTRPPRTNDFHCTIAKPAGMKFQKPPMPWAVDNPCCRANVTWTEEQDSLRFNAEFTVLKPEVTPEEYPQLKQAADEFHKPELWEVYFTK